MNDPDSAELLANQFTLLSARGKKTKAELALARRCEALAPNEFIAVFNLASAEMRGGLYDQSVQTFQRALKIAPKDREAVTLQHIGLAWYTAGHTDKALEWYAKCPDSDDLRQSIAIAKLQSGDLTAMYEFECKYHTPRRKPIAEAGIPRWMGEDVSSKTVIVAHEQGFGDTVQFARFIPRVRAKRLIWSGPESLRELMAENFRFDAMIGEDGPFDADYYCSPISICGALKADYASVDPRAYLRADPIKLPQRGKIRVGLVWAGNVDYAHDHERSMALTDLLPLIEIPGAAYYSFQVGRGEGEISNLGLDGLIANLGGTLRSWRDTARAVQAMDVIVSVDSGVAHVAGALGKPVLILLPYANCWRWMLNRTDTPWYASAKLFRQHKPGEWENPVLRVKRSIEGMMGERRNQATQAA